MLGLRSGSARVWLGLTRVYAKLPRVCAGLPRVRAGVASGVEGLRFNSAVLVGLCWGLLRFLNNFSLFRALRQECGYNFRFGFGLGLLSFKNYRFKIAKIGALVSIC